jgi:acyl carrier protein
LSKKLYEIISNVMNIPIDSLNEKSGPENIKNWDSFNGLVLIDEIESKFDVKFLLEEIIDVKTIKDIEENLKNHNVV